MASPMVSKWCLNGFRPSDHRNGACPRPIPAEQIAAHPKATAEHTQTQTCPKHTVPEPCVRRSVLHFRDVGSRDKSIRPLFFSPGRLILTSPTPPPLKKRSSILTSPTPPKKRKEKRFKHLLHSESGCRRTHLKRRPKISPALTPSSRRTRPLDSPDSPHRALRASAREFTGSLAICWKSWKPRGSSSGPSFRSKYSPKNEKIPQQVGTGGGGEDENPGLDTQTSLKNGLSPHMFFSITHFSW